MSEIRILKEEEIQKKLEAYQLELDEALRVALEEFRAANLNAPEITTLSTDEVVSAKEPEETAPVITEEIFIENYKKLNQEKFDAFRVELYKILEREMMALTSKRLSVLYDLYSKQFNQERFISSFNEFADLFKTHDSLPISLALDEEGTTHALQGFLNNFPVNPFVDPTIVLFLLRLNYSMIRILEKFRKVKFKKFKLKRRKLRKLYVLKKMKRIIVFRKTKKKTFETRSFFKNFEFEFDKAGSNILVKRMPLSKRVIENTSVEFFYKLNKKKNRNVIEDFDVIDEDKPDLFIYLRNYHQKPYHKLRKARIVH